MMIRKLNLRTIILILAFVFTFTAIVYMKQRQRSLVKGVKQKVTMSG